ncbi:hypothetical protein Gotur_018710, partial [Gossypium turneri]
KGNKPSNTFRAVSINRVVEAISERFQVQCDAKHVENHLRKAHKKYEPFLNKSIDHYDEMALVVGKDMATGSFARTFADIDLDDGNEDSMQVMSMEEEGFDDDFLCFVFNYLVSHESDAKAFLVKSKKHKKIWLQKFFQ